MKILHIGKQGNLERYLPKDSALLNMALVDLPIDQPAETYLKDGADADFIVVDAIAPVPGELIRKMPNLKLIHSEGVAFNQIDLKAAADCGVYVCNAKGMNAAAVAEQAVLLMVGMLRNAIQGDAAVRAGRQIEVKGGYIARGDLLELSDCAVGLIGYGDIAQATARLLRAYGVSKIYYNKRRRLSEAEEQAQGVCYAPVKTLLQKSDIVSLHLPVNAGTVHFADQAFFDAMRPGSYFVNTARGELVDDQALIEALETGKLAMAGLDTLDDEPVGADHPLLNQSEAVEKKIIFSPHIGGITRKSFFRSYRMIDEAVCAVCAGRRPEHVVNGR
ncbi:NAD(P)-dependent oxidoreductase [Pseudoramibacter sp.]|jgi:phosphoglycerate dehydrogenase-like enzyme|uniref:NAD(P)-dependent oxidoreductase n=1 Tax=Pseudoramibacter sp. TaxID=2034862 RepID=UPI0025DF645C|nr:NAD(P)-dependent oxidoreductase [Pseudoramibacter sp.]MCH4071369.1 hydroxyacid dehydrogenase [Pseudoramibacter sp.]MCH4105137.1 hydroxyacid dehydrogenase [Pseudoramibacter sp.]